MLICFSYFVFTIAIIQIPWSGLLLTSRVANPCTGGASSTMYKAPLCGEKVDKQKRILGIDLTDEAVRNLHRQLLRRGFTARPVHTAIESDSAACLKQDPTICDCRILQAAFPIVWY